MGRHKKVQTLEGEKTTLDAEIKITDLLKASIDNLERANTGICRRLDEIELRLAKLETPEIPKISVETPKELPTTTTSEQHYPVPQDYIEAVKTLLNSKFGIKIEPFSDRPQFAFTIVVPKEYSSLPPVEWETAKGDFRTRILSYADGINGVREWITKVFDSFNPEIKAKIKLEI